MIHDKKTSKNIRNNKFEGSLLEDEEDLKPAVSSSVGTSGGFSSCCLFSGFRWWEIWGKPDALTNFKQGASWWFLWFQNLLTKTCEFEIVDVLDFHCERERKISAAECLKPSAVNLFLCQGLIQVCLHCREKVPWTQSHITDTLQTRVS